ncbi:MAG: alpha/beta hydrolase, partial [bacterium]|nr:alpha/beta hydrolase [bacterium]
AAADDPRIGALWSGAGYADIAPILEARWPGASGLPMPFLSGTRVAHRLSFGFDPGGVRPEVEIARVVPRPIQRVHGTADTTVPYEHGLRLAAASGADLWKLPGVAHADAYAADPVAYANRAIEFFDAALRVQVASAGR